MPMATTVHSRCILIVTHLIYFIFHLRISICDNSSYVPSDNIALNCGSSSSGTSLHDDRNWTGDVGSEFMSSSQDNKSMTSEAYFMYPAVDEVPYGTARIFRSQFTYTFNVNPGPKFVRLHFYPSYYMGFNASEAFLTVTALGGRYTLLRNFSASLAVDYFNIAFLVREFVVNVNEKVLDITFAPSSNAAAQAYAFVNGIEVVSMPPDLYYIKGGDAPGVRFVGQDSNFYIDRTYALETCYRLNVGGSDIAPKHDTGMFRSWTMDNGYIFGTDSSELPYDFNITMRYPPAVPPYTAPEMVYRTARSMTADYRINLNYNLSWFFPVDSGFYYLVRLHFCEVDRKIDKQNQRVFNIFINNQTAHESADVIGWSGAYAVPVYQDYVVKIPEVGKGEKQDLWLDLHPSTASKPQYEDAILNGAEIFKLNNNDGNLASLNPPKKETTVDLSSMKPPNSKSSKKIIFIVAGCLLGGLLFFLMCFLAFPLKMIRKRTLSCLVQGLDYIKPVVAEKIYVSSPLCHHFSMDEIKVVTSNFDEALVIGIGGFGKVYKGYINGGATTTMIAVKRGSQMAEQGFHEFQTEIVMLSQYQLRHNNLVSLIGYCTADHEMILVYDYMANGALYDHLHTRKTPLTWEQRLKICTGAARGLYYLHTGAKHQIIHRDVKTSNILLDENWVPKISDFGLSKLGPVTSSSTEVKGSFGYLDPEYYRSHKLTEKSDVYSFGVVLLEVLCRRPAVNPAMEDEYQTLAEWALCHYQNGSIDQILDTDLQGIINRESFAKFMDIAKDCLAERGEERPSMGEVLWKLELALPLQNSAESGKIQRRLQNNIDGDGSTMDVCIGTHSNSDKTPGVEFSEIMMPVGR